MKQFHLALAAILTLAALAVVGCGGQDYDIAPTPAAPSVAGTLTVKQQNQANYKADLRLQYLPLPQNLGPGLSTYVAWVKPAGSDRYIRVGTIGINQGNREGEIKFTTPYQSFRVIVTAEKTPNVQQPGEPVIVTQQVVTD